MVQANEIDIFVTPRQENCYSDDEWDAPGSSDESVFRKNIFDVIDDEN